MKTPLVYFTYHTLIKLNIEEAAQLKQILPFLIFFFHKLSLHEPVIIFLTLNIVHASKLSWASLRWKRGVRGPLHFELTISTSSSLHIFMFLLESHKVKTYVEKKERKKQMKTKEFSNEELCN